MVPLVRSRFYLACPPEASGLAEWHGALSQVGLDTRWERLVDAAHQPGLAWGSTAGRPWSRSSIPVAHKGAGSRPGPPLMVRECAAPMLPSDQASVTFEGGKLKTPCGGFPTNWMARSGSQGQTPRRPAARAPGGVA